MWRAGVCVCGRPNTRLNFPTNFHFRDRNECFFDIAPQMRTTARHDGPSHLGIAMQCAPRASNGPNHLGLRAPSGGSAGDVMPELSSLAGLETDGGGGGQVTRSIDRSPR